MSKRKAALSRSCVTRVVHERKGSGEELRYISEWGGRKEERLPSRKKCTLEIKKLSLQLFHNSLDFRAGEQRGLCPSPTRNLPATFPSRSPLIFPGIRYNPPIEVQSPYRFCGNIYIYTYLLECGAITPSMISAIRSLRGVFTVTRFHSTVSLEKFEMKVRRPKKATLL